MYSYKFLRFAQKLKNFRDGGVDEGRRIKCYSTCVAVLAIVAGFIFWNKLIRFL